MALRPAALVGLSGRKGAIAPGCDADLVVMDPDATFTVDPSALHHRHKATPYEGRTLSGRVVATYLRGRRVAANGQPEGEPTGQEVGGSPGWLNALSEAEARAELLRCCGSKRWAERMATLRPFASEADLFAAADAVWQALDRADRLEAFTAHPRIGDLDALRAKFATTAAWAAGEQAGVAGARDDTLRRMAEGNRDYEARFGYIFIVCATGKTADEMLGLLLGRLGNDPETELAVAAREQAAITRLRLRKLCP
jgi:OHCU decarboxylase